MSDYPLCFENKSPAFAVPTLRHREPRSHEHHFAAATEDGCEHHFDWDSAALVAPGGLTPARQLAMQRQQERLSSATTTLTAPPRKPEETLG